VAVMPRVPIDDLDDPRIEIYRHLKATNATRVSRQFVVEGEKLFERLVVSRFPLASVLVTDRLEPRVRPRVPETVPLYVVPEDRIESIVGYNFHRGVLACGIRQPWPSLDDLIRSAGARAIFIICPRIDNPENLGSIVRIADVFGVGAIVAGTVPDPLSRRVLRVSMGSSMRVPLTVSDHLAIDVHRLRHDFGFATIATVADASAESVDTFRIPDRLALFLGCEGHGLGRDWLAHCQGRVTIPMRPGAESLNVAVAAGIILYHLSRAKPAKR
jgi:tRNA G18 (ribose-2'-O)-methylase SpoU